MDPTDYLLPGALTQLSDDQQAMVADVDDDPESLCQAAQHLLVLPGIPTGAPDEADRQQERNLRPARVILARALELDARPLDIARRLDRRVIGTCRHFAVLSCAFLRARGIPARARCGFATYFQPGVAVDHWITEYWHDHQGRWIRIDSEIVGIDLGLDVTPTDLPPGAFLTGPEAWAAYRTGADPMTFGVHDTENWGVAEIIGNAIRDLAALHRLEMLPWDEWGPMRACYGGTISIEVRQLMDDLVAATATSATADTTHLYRRVSIPDELIS